MLGRVDLLKVKDGVSEGKADEVCLSKILNADFADVRVKYDKKNVYDLSLMKQKMLQY